MRATRRPTGPAGHWRRALGKAVAVAVGFLLLAAGVAAQRSLGGSVDLWGSVGLEVDHRRLDDVSSQTAATLAAHLEGHLARGPWQVALTAEPRLPLAGAGTPVEPFSLGLIEGYLAFRAPLGDLQVGRILLPLETARLTQPYTITPRDEHGRRPGVDGARADLYLADDRLQLALVQRGDGWAPVAGWRRAFSGWELTAHGVLEAGRLVAGLGGSGLVGSVVVYGEGWVVPGEARPRAAVGATGYAGDLLWTGEVARAPFLPDQPPEPLAALQLAYAPTLGLSISLDGAATLEETPQTQWGLTATYELVPGTSDVEVSLGRLSLARGATWLVRTALRYYL